MALISGGDASKGAALNSSRSWIKSGLELFRMDSIGRAFLGGCLVSWGWVEVAASTVPAGRGAHQGQECGKWVPAPARGRDGMAVSPKLATSVTPRWDYGTHSPRSCLPSSAGCCSQYREPTRWNSGNQFHHSASSQPVPLGAALALPWLEYLPFRSHPEKTSSRAPQHAQYPKPQIVVAVVKATLQKFTIPL